MNDCYVSEKKTFEAFLTKVTKSIKHYSDMEMKLISSHAFHSQPHEITAILLLTIRVVSKLGRIREHAQVSALVFGKRGNARKLLSRRSRNL